MASWWLRWLASCWCLYLASASRYAAIVIDADSGRVLHEAYADDRKYPASLAKMMTLYLLFEALEKKRFSIEGRAAGFGPGRGHAAVQTWSETRQQNQDSRCLSWRW